jgi:hypothetical protein
MCQSRSGLLAVIQSNIISPKSILGVTALIFNSTQAFYCIHILLKGVKIKWKEEERESMQRRHARNQNKEKEKIGAGKAVEKSSNQRGRLDVE